MKLHINIDTPEEGDLQSPVPQAALEEFARILGEELERIVPNACQYEDVILSVVLMDSAEMRETNREHRDIDEATDVLSFPLWEEEGKLVLFPLLPGPLLLGDILICPEEVKRIHEALPYPEALCLMLAHGFLHLLSWDHDTPEREAAMWEYQDLLKTRLLEALEGVR